MPVSLADPVVVTGATGHIGNVLVRALVARGGRVRCLVLPSDNLRPLAGLAVEVVRGDVRDPRSLDAAFAGAGVVFHLASLITLTPGQARLLHEVNVAGARNVAEACLKAGVRRLVHTSSVHAMAEPPEGVVIDESAPFDPARIRFEYGRTKALGTLEVLAVARRGLDAVVVCPTGVIGPYDFAPSEMGRLFLAFARRRVWACPDGGYDFVDVRDAAEGHLLAAEKGRAGESYLLSGERITVAELMTVLAEVTGAPAPRWRVPGWLADAAAPVSSFLAKLTGAKPLFTKDSLYYLRSNSRCRHDKATRELGYGPRPVRESVADAVRWFEEAGRLRPQRLKPRTAT